jgi:hypothetical protein
LLKKGDQNRKILEELQKKQQALKQQTQQTTGSGAGINSTSIVNNTVIAPKVLPSLNTKLPNPIASQPSPTNLMGMGSMPMNPNGQQYGPSDLTGNGPFMNAAASKMTVSAATSQMFPGGSAVGASGSSGNNQRERAALLHAHQNSFGFFISQDSSFGNQILPVIPML